jgi:uncharacterized membrane protein YheB (UPF0754 family)
VDIQSIVDDFGAHWHIYVTMPFIASAIGYITKRVAIEMMFRPLEFVGVRIAGIPFGWQGVLPGNAHRMATIAMDLLTTSLINPKEIFSRLDPKRVATELHDPLLRSVEQLTRELMAEYQPGMWEMLPEPAQRLLLRRVETEAPRVVEQIIRDLADNIEDILDVKGMAVEAMVRDKALLNRLIREVSKPELRFIAHSGIYFGFVIGLVQMITWALTHNVWIMPLFGGLTGWLTDWLALKMIFFPRTPHRYLGLFTWQGMFQRRRMEVSRDYGRLVADEILTVRNVLHAILTGSRSDRLFALVHRHVLRSIDANSGIAKPVVVMSIGSRRYQEMKETAAKRALDLVPDTLRHVESYATEALDVRNTIIDQMQRLTPVQYEGILRPAFRQDEWKLIAVGAIIGFLVGELQVVLLLH